MAATQRLTGQQMVRVGKVYAQRYERDTELGKSAYNARLHVIAAELYPGKLYPGQRAFTPILDAHLIDGTITADEFGVFVGIASDGVSVQIGNRQYPEYAEAYLTEHSTPETW